MSGDAAERVYLAGARVWVERIGNLRSPRLSQAISVGE